MAPEDPPTDRSILHVDMDAFFAAVEQLDNPELRGKPVLVGGTGPRGVVSTASYEARPYGCHSAMPMAQALRLCPHAVVVKGSFARYKEIAGVVREVFESVTPVVQPVSIDEAYLDITGSARALGAPIDIARKVKTDIRARTGLTASVGLAPNKLLAKLASERDKPDGLTIVPSDRAAIESFLYPLSVGAIPGIGKASVKRYNALGIRTVGDLASYPAEALGSRLGPHALSDQRRARGIDERPVRLEREMKSVSHERTFSHDKRDADEVRAVIVDHAARVASRLRDKGLVGRTVVVKIRFGEYQTITRSHTLPSATSASGPIRDAALGLFDAWVSSSFQPVRLIGVGVHGLGEAMGDGSGMPAGAQLGLFDDMAPGERARGSNATDGVLDDVTRRFGHAALRPASATTVGKRRL